MNHVQNKNFKLPVSQILNTVNVFCYFQMLTKVCACHQCDRVAHFLTRDFFFLMIEPPQWTLMATGQPQARSACKSSAARHVHSLSHILTCSRTHVDNRACNGNLTAQADIITERWWESHNHKDSNRNLNQRMSPNCFVPSVYTGPLGFVFRPGKPIVLGQMLTIL